MIDIIPDPKEETEIRASLSNDSPKEKTGNPVINILILLLLAGLITASYLYFSNF